MNEQPEATTTEKGWWKKLYGVSKAALDVINEPRNMRTLKRKFESAYDSADDKIEKAEQKRMKIREKLHEMDINELVEANLEIKNLTDVKNALVEEHLEMFGENLKVK